jgi:hypothetical protein
MGMEERRGRARSIPWEGCVHTPILKRRFNAFFHFLKNFVLLPTEVDSAFLAFRWIGWQV